MSTERYTYDLTGRYQLVAASYLALLDQEGRVLLHLRQGTGYMDGHWALLAGHVDPEEPVTEAACREAREEAGVVVEPGALEPLCTLHRFIPGGGAREQRADFFFAARSWHGTPRIMDPDKAAQMEFFALDDLPEPVVPHELRVLEALAAGHVPAVMVHRTE